MLVMGVGPIADDPQPVEGRHAKRAGEIAIRAAAGDALAGYLEAE